MTALVSKPNWAEVKNQWSAWWNNSPDRQPIFIAAVPNPNHPPLEALPAVDAINQWTNSEYLCKAAAFRTDSRLFMEQSFPWACASLGPGSANTMLGTEPHFAPSTVWYDPCWQSIENATIQFQPDNEWYKWTISTTKALVNAGKNKWLVAIPDLMENIDVISAMRGNMELLLDLMDEPEHIHRLQKQLLPVWKRLYDEIYDLVKDEQGGSVFEAFEIWAPGRILKAQCDFSAMIGKPMFDEFVLPYLVEQLEMVDYTMYHLDGPDAIKHLDSVLSMERLRCLQWVPGAGKPDMPDPVWNDIYRKTLDAGKAIHIGVAQKDALDFAKRWGTKDLLMIVYCGSEAEASSLIGELRSLKYS